MVLATFFFTARDHAKIFRKEKKALFLFFHQSFQGGGGRGAYPPLLPIGVEAAPLSGRQLLPARRRDTPTSISIIALSSIVEAVRKTVQRP